MKTKHIYLENTRIPDKTDRILAGYIRRYYHVTIIMKKLGNRTNFYTSSKHLSTNELANIRKFIRGFHFGCIEMAEIFSQKQRKSND